LNLENLESRKEFWGGQKVVDVVGGWVVVVGWLVKNIIKFPGIENNLPCFQELFIKNM
jgi:hypothetical protein